MCVSFAHLMLAFIEISLVCAPLVGIKLLYAKRTQEFLWFPENFVFFPTKNIRQHGICLMVDSIPELTLVRLTLNKQPLFIKFCLFTC